MIKEFYAITIYRGDKYEPSTSVYWVYIDADNNAVAKKIAVRGPSGRKVGEKIPNGSVLGVDYMGGLQMYNPWKGTRLDQVNTFHWGGCSSKIAALFLSISEAMMVFNTTDDFQHWDERFRKFSEHVIKMIGTADDTPIRLDSALVRAVENNDIDGCLQRGANFHYDD